MFEVFNKRGESLFDTAMRNAVQVGQEQYQRGRAAGGGMMFNIILLLALTGLGFFLVGRLCDKSIDGSLAPVQRDNHSVQLPPQPLPGLGSSTSRDQAAPNAGTPGPMPGLREPQASK